MRILVIEDDRKVADFVRAACARTVTRWMSPTDSRPPRHRRSLEGQSSSLLNIAFI